MREERREKERRREGLRCDMLSCDVLFCAVNNYIYIYTYTSVVRRL